MSDQPMPDKDIAAALKDLDEAVRVFAALMDGDKGYENPGTVTSALVLWETAHYEQGDMVYEIDYTFPSPMSLSSAAGLLSLGGEKVMEDLTDPGEDPNAD